MTGPKRVLIVGDTHGNLTHWVNVLLPAARQHQVDTVVELGDFGYWPRTGEGVDYLALLSAELDKLDLTVYWLDGNHEDHQALGQLKPRQDDFVEITDRLLWAPRGQRWEWAGVKFLAVGGAWSPDRAQRKLDSGRWGWFREELLTSEQANAAINGGPCDVLLTHDAPESTIDTLKPAGMLGYSFVPSEARQTQQLLQRVADTTRPRLLLHGHWHHPYQTVVNLGAPGSDPSECQVVGLACDEMPGSWAVLDLPSLELTQDPLPSVLAARREALLPLRKAVIKAPFALLVPESALKKNLSSEQLESFGGFMKYQTVTMYQNEPYYELADVRRWVEGADIKRMWDY